MEQQITKIELLQKEKLELRKELIEVSNMLLSCKDSDERKELIILRSEIKADIADIDAEILSSSDLNEEQLDGLESTIDNEALDKEEEALKHGLNELQPKHELNEEEPAISKKE